MEAPRGPLEQDYSISATTGLGLAQGPCPPTKLLASVACGSLSSERGFPRNGSVKRPDATGPAAYFYSHYNLGTCLWSGFAHRVLSGAGLCDR